MTYRDGDARGSFCWRTVAGGSAIVGLLGFCVSSPAQFVAQRGAMKAKQGVVTYERPATRSAPASVPQALDFGDRLQTAELSWAVVEFSDLSRTKVRELSVLEIVQPAALATKAGLKLHRGSAYVADLPKGRDFPVETPHARVTPRGTEFLIEVSETQTRVVMFDGAASLENDLGRVEVSVGEQGLAEPGKAPLSARIETVNLVLWWLYYPGVLDPDELRLTAQEQQRFNSSLAAYRSGDLAGALQRFPSYPGQPVLESEAERIYYCGLLLSVGAVDKAEAMLKTVAPTHPLARAVDLLITAVGSNRSLQPPPPASASEWLALSYYRQSQHDLEGALQAARRAIQQSSRFGLAWARVAELEFSFGRIQRAGDALQQAIKLSPHNAQAHALKGFLLAAEYRHREAVKSFEEAIRLDAGLGNAWLGRGLCRIRLGERMAGREDLQTAALLEPNRSLLHSYLGKAFHEAGQAGEALKELEFARKLDTNDPTPLLYSALINHEQHRINTAVNELERSIDLNDNRAVYRSRLLLDQDRAVRSSSLANVYQTAGMEGVSLGEAARAVSYDYANHSAHQFLSESFDALRDPTRFNLRYETVWFQELLLANLLAPVGATPLSQQISQQEYSRLFDRDRFGLSSATEYRSDGQIRERASQYGTFGRTSYALDLDYQHNDGVRPNNELDRIEWYSTLKHQITSQDSVLLLAKYQDFHSGDNFQYYDPRDARRDFSFDESQKPILIGGYHREWTPGVHTLLLGGRLVNDQTFKDRQAPAAILFKDPADAIVARGSVDFDFRHRSEMEAYLAEAQQIFETDRQLVLVGARYQRGEFETQSRISNPSANPGLFDDPAAEAETTSDFERASAYAYYTLEVIRHLRLTAGLAYEHLQFPANFRSPPIRSGEQERERFNPKAALVWNPIPQLTWRGVYARSLGGVSLDESYRLEPAQLAGFSQSFRTLISESLVGSVEAPDYETAGTALDFKLKSRTYLGFQVERSTADVKRNVGVFDYVDFTAPIRPSTTRQHLDYEEWSAGATLNQLLSEEWSTGLRYQFTRSELESIFPEIPAALPPPANRHDSADLHQAGLLVIYNHPSGLFARAESLWFFQSNSGSVTNLPSETFQQLNLLAGYRFRRQRGDLTLGVLNVTAEDYHLNPLTPYAELPRERVFLARLRFNF